MQQLILSMNFIQQSILRKTKVNLVITLTSIIWTASCKTIVIPLPGTHVLKPRAATLNFGVSANAGVSTDPSVEGTLPAVKDKNNETINPVPKTKDANGNDTERVSPMIVADINVEFAKRFNLGASSERGLFGMVDYALWDQAALTLSSSFATSSVEGGDQTSTTETTSSGESRTTFSHGFKGSCSNFNITQLASTWIGSPQWAAFYLYGGAGLNSFTAQITSKTSDLKEKTTQIAPTGLFGISTHLLVFDVTLERAFTRLTYRDDTSTWVATSAGTMGLHVVF